jgi:dolichol-phosphate hexosyltransferase
MRPDPSPRNNNRTEGQASVTPMHSVDHSEQLPSPVRLSIVMPAYNEAPTIRRAIEHVLSARYPCPIELIVVDDGSSDGTSALIADIEDDRLVVHRHVRNMGKGAALLTGISVATGTHLLPFDADLEYSAHDIAPLLQPVIEGRCDVVYGTRLFGVNTVYRSFRYMVGNKVLTLATNVLFDAAISDLHTCLKLVPLAMLRKMKLVELGFGLDTEITARVLRTGSRPFEVPISYFSRSHSEGKKINWKDAVHCVRVLGRVRLARIPREDGSAIALPSGAHLPQQQPQTTAIAEPGKHGGRKVLVLTEPAGHALTEAAE